MSKSIWRQCTDPGERRVWCYTPLGGIDWLLGWALASSIFRSLAIDNMRAELRLNTDVLWTNGPQIEGQDSRSRSYSCIFWVTAQERKWKNRSLLEWFMVLVSFTTKCVFVKCFLELCLWTEIVCLWKKFECCPLCLCLKLTKE